MRLNQLPWYLLIGPQNAGKTSLLANSNVNFILQRQFQNQDTKNLGTSENCNWWVTRDASIIDVPGKYFSTLEKPASLPPFWQYFLRLIRKQRGKTGIDGIVIAFPLPELMAENDSKKFHALMRQLMQRLHEMKKLFPKPVPCYVLITKCDLLPGFTEYFSELGSDETTQAWGVLLPEPEHGETFQDLFAQRFNPLIKKLNQQLIWRLHQERNPKMRPAIKDFPLHVERLKESTYDFIKKLSGARLPITLQGVFLTSALQVPKEAPVHLLDDNSQASFRAIEIFQEPVLATRPYFIRQFITHGLNSAQPAFSPQTKKQIWSRRAALAASVFAITLTFILLGRDFGVGVEKAYSIQNNLTEYRLAIRSFHNPDEHLLKTTELLDTLRKSVKHMGFKLDLAHLLTFYSYKSQEKAALVYQEALQTVLLPEIKKYLEDYLTLPINRNSDAVYAVLKAYLMLGDASHLQIETFQTIIQSILPNSINPTDVQHLLLHLSVALSSMAHPLLLDTEVIQKTRGFLTSTPPAQLGYIILKNMNGNDTASAIHIGVNTSPTSILTSPHTSNQIPAMFTAKLLGDILNQELTTAAQEVVQGNWVLGSNVNADLSQIAPLIDQLRALYISHYISAWETLVDNIHLISAKNLQETDAVILHLIGVESPLLQLLETLRNNTYFQPLTTASPKLESLSLLVNKDSPSSTLLFQLFSGLRLLHQYLQPIIHAQDPKKAAFEALSYRINHNDKPDALTQLRILAEKSPKPIKDWIDQLTNDAWHMLMSEAGHYINTAWDDQVMRFYRSNIGGRYPFKSTSAQEVDLQNFTLFFGKPGIVSNFYHVWLEPMVNTSKPDWQWKTCGNEKAIFSDEFLHQLQQALRIQHVFYPNADNKMYVQFAIEPFQFGTPVKNVRLNINAKQVVDGNTSAHNPHVITWPNTGKLKMTSLQFTMKNKEIVIRQFPGDWGWFKLVNQSYENAVTKKQTLLNFSNKKIPVKYYLYTDAQVNPFLSLNLKQFNLPERLM